mgnify:CR=1 FL=1
MADARVLRPTRAEVNLGALRRNVTLLAQRAAPAELWVVVKADAYGHRAAQCAAVVVQAGARGLCVALAQEGVALREAGITVPILVLSEQSPAAAELLVAHDLTCVVYNEHYVAALADAARRAARQIKVHLKIDTGMHRVGAEPEHAKSVVSRVIEHSDALRLTGVYTHFAAADFPERPHHRAPGIPHARSPRRNRTPLPWRGCRLRCPRALR